MYRSYYNSLTRILHETVELNKSIYSFIDRSCTILNMSKYNSILENDSYYFTPVRIFNEASIDIPAFSYKFSTLGKEELGQLFPITVIGVDAKYEEANKELFGSADNVKKLTTCGSHFLTRLADYYDKIYKLYIGLSNQNSSINTSNLTKPEHFKTLCIQSVYRLFADRIKFLDDENSAHKTSTDKQHFSFNTLIAVLRENGLTEQIEDLVRNLYQVKNDLNNKKDTNETLSSAQKGDDTQSGGSGSATQSGGSSGQGTVTGGSGSATQSGGSGSATQSGGSTNDTNKIKDLYDKLQYKDMSWPREKLAKILKWAHQKAYEYNKKIHEKGDKAAWYQKAFQFLTRIIEFCTRKLHNFVSNKDNQITWEYDKKNDEKDKKPTNESFKWNTNRIIFCEGTLSSNQRTDFGLPRERKYPMPDKAHVLAAIRMFNHVDPYNEKELATNIKKKMRQYRISPNQVGEKNRLKKYL